MTYANKFSGFWHGSMLAALTVCMAVALVDVARSATPDGPPSVRVRYGDLNLASEQGASTLHARLATAARQVCAPHGFETRNLQAYSAQRSCAKQAMSDALRQVQATQMASVAARHGQG